MENQEKTLASEYNDLKEKRESWISAAKEAAKYTLPSIINDDTTVTKSKNKSSFGSILIVVIFLILMSLLMLALYSM